MSVSSSLASAGVAAALGAMLAGCGGGGGDTTPAPTPSPEPVVTTMVDIGGGMEFTCQHTPQTCEGGTNENVFMLHGFPNRKEVYTDLMIDLAGKNYCGLACDMHGVSPGAAPAEKSKYENDAMRTDAFKIARTFGFSKFHLIGHDLGCILGFRLATSPVQADREMVQSYVALSVPHNDATSKALLGPESDMDQQVASQYFAVFVQPNSANLDFFPGTSIFDFFKCEAGGCFDTAEAFQKFLYWYSGIFDSQDGGVKVSMPPDFDLETILNSTSPGKAGGTGIRRANPDLNGTGNPQVDTIGNIHVPVLYVCGNLDTAVQCSTPMAKTTEDYCKAGYQYLEVTCGHYPLAPRCDDAAESKKVHDGILAHLEKYNYTQRVAHLQEFV